MSVSLNPVTLEKLQQFGRRRRRLVLTRGLCSAIVSFLLVMSLVALLDWWWVLPDGLRWSLSGIGYTAVLVVVWLTSVRLMVRMPSHEELAQRFELAEPQLRENLLSAIELGRTDEAMYDSPIFRRLLQSRVGQQIAGVNVRALLPFRLLKGWLAGAAVILLIWGVLLALPGMPFRQLMTRAMLPGANIDRISRIQVTILQPTPHSLTLPQDETVAVVVEVGGGDVDEVTIETRTEGNGVSRQPMTSRDTGRFSANVSVGDRAIDYRILAGDAVTRYHTISSRPRPSVRQFEKTFRYPDYSGLETRTLTESNGDLVALEGTVAEMVMELDQEVTGAEIRVERSAGEQAEVIDLVQAGPMRWRASLPLIEPGVYKVHLVGKETGFENIFSPKYEIRPEPDLAPRVGFVDQQDTTLLLPPNDILALKGLAEDDLPLVGLEQYISVNGREWQAIPLEIQAVRRATAEWDWDLLDLKLNSGDQVTTKLVATDRRGNLGESIPLRIVVSSPEFDPQRHAVMKLKTELYDKLADLADAVTAHRDSAKTIMQRLGGDDTVAPPSPEDRASLLDLAQKIRDETEQVLQYTTEILPQMPAGADALELELVARVLSRVQHETMTTPEVYLDASQEIADAKQAKKNRQQVVGSYEKSADSLQRLEERYRDLTTHNLLAAVALDLHGLLQHQRQLLAPGTPQSWQRLVRQETVAMSLIEEVERLVRSNLPRLGNSTQTKMLQLLDWTRSSRERIQGATESESQKATLERTAQTLLRELEGRQNAVSLESRLPATLIEARKEMDERAGSLFESLERIAQTASDASRSARKVAESDDSTEIRELAATGERAVRELGHLHAPGMTRLKTRRTVTQQRRDSDSQYASDVGLTRRAVVGLLEQYEDEQPQDSEVPGFLTQIAPAYRILEAGHELVEIRDLLDRLIARERWESQQLGARLDHPRQWDAVQSAFAIVANKLRKAGFPADVATAVDRLRYSQPAQEAGRKISARRYRFDAPVAATAELMEIKTDVDEVVEQIGPRMAEARELIASYVPSLPEMAKRAAEDLRSLENQASGLADQREDMKEEQARPQVAQLQAEQRQVNQQIEELTDALIEDANAQDLLSDEGRERARDADDSMAMIREPAARMNQAMQQAATATEPTEQARELSQAAEQQERAAQALDQIAEHYERLETGQDVAETRDALRQAEREMGIARQMDQRYGEAEQLGEMAEKSPEELLAELEQELQQNPPMQNALSEISENAVEQAKNSLEYSAEQEASMQRAMEQSDQDFQANKKALAQELRDLAQEASDLGRNLVAQADSAASRGQVQSARPKLKGAQQELSEAASRPRNISEGNVLDDMVAAARDMASALEDASRNLQHSRDETAKAKDQKFHDEESKRAAQQREMEASLRRLLETRRRDAKNRVRDRERHQSQVNNQVRSTENSLRNAEKQVTQARQKLKGNPDSNSARQQLEQSETRRDEAQATVERAKRQMEVAKQRTARAKQVEEELARLRPEPLKAANPAAELANRLADEATKLADELATRAKELAAPSTWSEEFSPDSRQLASAAEQQEGIGEDVAQAGEDVARASRHEERLGKPAVSQKLGDAAESIDDVAQNEVAGSQQQLSDTAEADSQDGGMPTSEQAMSAHASVGEAQEAIAREAESLGEILAAAEAAAGETQATADAGQQSPSPNNAASPSSEESSRGELLARTLDELDQAMASPSQGSETPGTPRRNLPSLAQAAQAQNANMAQSRMEARNMSQNQPPEEGSLIASDGASIEAFSPLDSSLKPVNRLENEEWGQLRGKSAEDLTEGRRETVSAEYRERVETYFRVIAERARKK